MVSRLERGVGPAALCTLWLERRLLSVRVKQISHGCPATPCAPSPALAPHIVASMPKRSGNSFPHS